MSVEQEDVFRVRLLDGAPRVMVDGRPAALIQRCLEILTLLVLRHPQPVRVAELIDTLGTSRGGVQASRSRLKAVGIMLVNNRTRDDYRLDLDPAEVDLLEFLRVASSPPADRDEGETERALSWWGLGPDPDLMALMKGLFAPVMDAHKRLLRQRKKRVLIVDDKVGEHLKTLLGNECSCTVVTDVTGFNTHALSLQEFDLALVDVHLTDSYMDHQGLEIMDKIVNSSTDVILLGMTKKPPPGGTLQWRRQHDLVEMINKAGDDETADFTAVLAQVRAALKAGPAGQATRLMEDFPVIYEEARTRLKAKGASAEKLKDLRRDIQAVHDLHLDDRPLAELRERIRKFREDWDVPYSLS